MAAAQCQPIEGSWLNWTGRYEAKCQDMNSEVWAGAAINIAFDFATLGLPLPTLVKLSLTKKKKIMAIVMFGIGFL